MEIEKRRKLKSVTGRAKDVGVYARSTRPVSSQPSQVLSDVLAAYVHQVPPQEAAVLVDALVQLRKVHPSGTASRPSTRPKTCTVEQAAVLCGISRGSAYQAAKNGELPVQRIGRRILVLVEPLMRMLDGQAMSAPSLPPTVRDSVESEVQ